jgi:hypothetical protein
MDPYTLAYLAGHSDFATTRRYVHPRRVTVLQAMGRAQQAQGWAQIERNDREDGFESAEEKPEAIENSKGKLARPEGLEPPAYWFEANRSIQLSYGRGSRDRDLIVSSRGPR